MASSATNRQLANVFRLALANVDDGQPFRAGKQTFICLAIQNVGSVASYVQDAAKAIVMARLYPFNSMGGWLRHKIGEPQYSMVNYQEMQEHRIAWLKLLIEEFETKKD